MAVELIRDLLKLDQTIGEGYSQALVEGDILVPDIKPDVSRMLSVDGVVNLTGKEAVQDKIIVDGTVNFKILYVSEAGDYPVYSMDASASFSQNIDIEGTTPDMEIDVTANVEHIDFNVINERKVSVKAVVNLTGKSMTASRIEVLRDIVGMEDVQVQREKVCYNDPIGSNRSETMVRESFELEEGMPDIEDIIKCDAYALEKESQVTDGKVIVTGVVKTNTLYIGDDGRHTLYLVKHEIPFTHFVEVSSAMRDMDCKVWVKADEVGADVKENIDQDRRILEIEAAVKIFAEVSELEEKEVLVDVYSPSKVLKNDMQKVCFNQTVGKNAANMMIKETVEVSSGEPEIFKVFDVNTRPVVTDMSLTEDKCIIEGVVEANILYLSQNENQPVYNFRQEIPFRHFVEIPGLQEGMEADVALHIQDVDYRLINPQQVELKINVGAACTATKKLEMNVLVNVEETEEEIDLSKRPSITIYYVQPGDTLWKIAKRYHTTVKELVETNDIQNPDRIMPGDQIIIQKRYMYQF